MAPPTYPTVFRRAAATPGSVGRLARRRKEWPLRYVVWASHSSRAHCASREVGASLSPAKNKTPARGARGYHEHRRRWMNYLILASLNSTCLRTTGSYFLKLSFSVWV